MSDFGGRWSVTLKNRGGQRKLRGGQGQKAGAVVWQWVPTFKEAVPPRAPSPPDKERETPTGTSRRQAEEMT